MEGVVGYNLSTNYCSERLSSGEAIVERALELGFEGLELGYLLTAEQADGIERARRRVACDILSVHAFSPVPEGAPYGYPELYSIASPEDDERVLACYQLLKTLETATRFGAKYVVCHAGRIELRRWRWFSYRSRLKAVAATMGTQDAKYLKLLECERRLREACAKPWREAMCRALDLLLPKFETAGVALCLENIPSFEAFPDGEELMDLQRRYPTPALKHWHDLGHGEIRDRHGWEPSVPLLKQLLSVTGGVHIHDVLGRDHDHLAPGKGQTDFRSYAFLSSVASLAKVFEPSSEVLEEDLRAGLALIKRFWE